VSALATTSLSRCAVGCAVATSTSARSRHGCGEVPKPGAAALIYSLRVRGLKVASRSACTAIS
jgi:hypothetical protein